MFPNIAQWGGNLLKSLLPKTGLQQNNIRVAAPNYSTAPQTTDYGNGWQFGTTPPVNISQAAPGLSTGQVLGASTSAPTYKPSVSGGTGQTAPSAAPVTTAPTQPSADTGQLDLLRKTLEATQGKIAGQAVPLQENYDLGVKQLEGYKTDATTDATDQIGQNNTQFGNILADQIRTYQDLQRQKQGVFSSLGTLDSSEFQNQYDKNQQNLGTARNDTLTEQEKQNAAVTKVKDRYIKDVDNQLGQYKIQYDTAKEAIKQSLADNNIQEAQALSDYINQLSGKADELQNMRFQAASLKDQGVNTSNLMKEINGNGYASNIATQLGQARAFGDSLLPQMTQNQGQGYIGKSGKQYRSLAEAILAGDNA
jgi:hypothetical protein